MPSSRSSKFVRFALAAAITLSGAVATTAATVATATTAQAASSVGGPITRSEVIQRAQYWIGKSIPYNQSGTYPDSSGRNYRTDCGGYVDMAWHLADGPNTQGLESSAYTTQISRSDLKAGDILNSYWDHVILFEKWDDSAHTTFSYYSFGSTPVKHVTGVSINAAYFDSHPNGDYKALRYNKIVDDATVMPTNVQLDIVGGDGALYSQFGNYSSGSFNSAWTAISGVPISRLTSVNVGGNLVHFYAVADGRVFGRDHIPSSNTWTGWSEIPGGAANVKDIAATAVGSNVILSIVGGDGVLYTQYGNYDAGHFDASWVRRSGAELTRISSVTGDSNTVRIYAVGPGGRVYGADYTLYSNSVGAWGEIPGGATGVKDITASTSGTNVILSVIGADGTLYTQFGNYAAGHFDPSWVRRSGAELTNLSSVPAFNGDVVRIYAVGPGGRVYGADYTLYANSVGAWGEIPGNATNAQDIAAANSN
ncbi:hypothetical protein [Kitasatospora griseola]|uniref:hypothetical protein n=1 Tax=Kitasatospora griseola TaxID=2064 RepID=UPI00343DEB7F